MKRGVNLELAKIFFDMSNIYAIKKIQWKPQAYFRAAKELTDMRESIVNVYKKYGLKGLKELPAIGEGIAGKIEEYIKTGKIKEYDLLKKGLPEKLAAVAKIPGIGPRKAKILFEKLKIKSVPDLKKAIKLDKISKLEGFGSKSQQNIAESLKVYKSQTKRRPFSEVNHVALKIKRRLSRLLGTIKIDVCGSLRRKSPTIRDIDMLGISKNSFKLIDYFCKQKEVKKIIAKGSTKASILWFNNIEVDLRVVPLKSYGAALLYFTGGKDYNIKMRQIAIRKGMKLSEYGLFDRKTGKLLAGKNEKDIFKKLGIKYIPPEKR